MNTKFSRIFAMILALIMCMALSVTVFADEIDPQPDPQPTITITKNLIMKSGAAVPNATFNFKLEAADSSPSEGINSEYSVTFTASDYVAADGGAAAAKETMPGKPGAPEAEGYKYATETFTIDFSGVTFPNPGVYEYTLTEDSTPTSPYNIAAGSNAVHKIYVHVYTNEDTGLPYVQYITVGSADSTTKSDGFDNEYNTYNLTLNKEVAGNQASHTDHFKFTVKVTVPEGTATIYTVTTNCTDEVENPTTITANADTVFNLKGGETITIGDLPAGTTYTITEESTGYTVTYKVNDEGEAREIEETDGKYTTDGTLNSDTEVTFTNTKGGTIPTGVLLTIAPFAVLMVIGIAGALFIVLKKKRSDVK